MKHELPPLPYALDALAPVISAETLEHHHGKHHLTYVNTLNNLIPGTAFESLSLTDLVKQAPEGAIFNNAAQVWNHNFYWHCLSPNSSGKPVGKLATAIDRHFGSFEKFKQAFTTAAIAQFGSGWAWLTQNSEGVLSIETTSNAHTPLRVGQSCLLTCDVWEHAYYIDYRNRRPAYVEKFWELVNWEFADAMLSKESITP